MNMIPARKFTITAIRERLRQGPLTEFDYARFEKGAQKDISDNAANGLAALGILACLRGHVDKMRDFHLRAILADDRGFLQTFNYATSLCICDLHEEARQLALKALVIDPVNLDMLYVIVQAEYVLGFVSESFEHLKRWSDLVKDVHPMALEIAEALEDEDDVSSAREEIARGECITLDELKAELSL